MKSILFVLLLSPVIAFGQVKIEKSALQIQREQLSDSIKGLNNSASYDSLCGNIKSDRLHLLMGQKIIIKPHCKTKTPYTGFYNMQRGLYAPVKLSPIKTGCAYDSLEGRVFDVIGFEKKPQQKIYIADNRDSLYITSEAYRDCLIEGYVVKLSNDYLNKKYARVVNSFDNDPIDFKTGKPVKLKAGEIWIVKRVIIDADSGDILAILSNSAGNELSERIDGWLSFFDDRYKPKSDSDNWKRKYGEFCWRKIMKNEIYVGMPASAVKLSWGEPRNINNASYGEQWVYSDKYVYIRNGKVTGWN